jgi:hypothetical protein
MPVPKRRKATGVMSLVKSPLVVLKLFDIDFMFQKLRIPLFYGFAPGVVLLGMFTQPSPTSWFDLINIW